MKKLTKIMIEELNLKLKDEGSCLRYIDTGTDSGLTTYQLIIEDEYINNEYSSSPNITKKFEKFVREFFKQYNVEKTGYNNTVSTLISYTE